MSESFGSKREQYVMKLKQAASAAALIANYDGVHRHEVETVLLGVEAELALSVDARAGRHAGDKHFGAEQWEEAHNAYTSALTHGHSKQVYVNFQNALALFHWAESLHNGTAKGKSTGKSRMRNKMKTVVATSAHTGSFSTESLMKNNMAVIVSARFATQRCAHVPPS